MTYLFYIILGFLPSIIWLLFYLRKDAHPEPNSMVIKIFIWGMLLAPLAIVLEFSLIWIINPEIHISKILSTTIPNTVAGIFLGVAVIPAAVEEYLKYLVVKFKVLKNPEFDEPLDAMLYCIIAALGFAAVENLLILLKTPLISPIEALSTTTFRFLGATFLHTLASGIVGYYLAKALLYSHKRNRLIFQGLLIATIFHISYNYLIINILTLKEIALLSIVILLGVMAVITSYFFKKLKKELSVCKIKI